MVPAERTRLIVGHELEGALIWAGRHGVSIDWLPDLVEVRAKLVQPETGQQFFLRGNFDGYHALPPAWTFTDSDWRGGGRLPDFPKGVQTRFGQSMFLSFNGSGIICAPFNRLAYQMNSGPHGDWGGLDNWMNAATAQVHAETIGDMLQSVYRDFDVTRERMGRQ